MEQPDITYTRPQISVVPRKELAVSDYNRRNNCEYYYGRLLAWAVEHGNGMFFDKMTPPEMREQFKRAVDKWRHNPKEEDLRYNSNNPYPEPLGDTVSVDRRKFEQYREAYFEHKKIKSRDFSSLGIQELDDLARKVQTAIHARVKQEALMCGKDPGLIRDRLNEAFRNGSEYRRPAKPTGVRTGRHPAHTPNIMEVSKHEPVNCRCEPIGWDKGPVYKDEDVLDGFSPLDIPKGDIFQAGIVPGDAPERPAGTFYTRGEDLFLIRRPGDAD